MGGRLRLGRKRIPVEDGDTIASAMYRAGVRTFSRSLKYHRRRGPVLRDGRVSELPRHGRRRARRPLVRDSGPRRDARAPGAVGGRRSSGTCSRSSTALHVLLPVGFYYKTFIRPRWLWAVADRAIRRAVGLGPPAARPGRGAARRGTSSATCSWWAGASRGGRPPSRRPLGASVRCCATKARSPDPPEGVDVLARHAAIGTYEGPDGGARVRRRARARSIRAGRDRDRRRRRCIRCSPGTISRA